MFVAGFVVFSRAKRGSPTVSYVRWPVINIALPDGHGEAIALDDFDPKTGTYVLDGVYENSPTVHVTDDDVEAVLDIEYPEVEMTS